jgi:hypothetical protein
MYLQTDRQTNNIQYCYDRIHIYPYIDETCVIKIIPYKINHFLKEAVPWIR